MDLIVTTMAELIDAFIAADRPAPLGASRFRAWRSGADYSYSGNSRLRRRLALLGVFLAGVLLGDP